MKKQTASDGYASSMTQGPIGKRMVSFAVPLFLGNLFQQLYNTADSLIVGNLLGSDALAAVSSSSSLIFLMVGLFNGIFIGAGVVIARYYGAGDTEKVQRSIHTVIAFGMIAGVLLTIIGLTLAPVLLRWMGTPAEVMPNSVLYFRVYFMGSLAFVLYNSFVGILQSVGDSRHPLFYLIISSVTNVVLDLLFIGLFRWGVGAAALATILSQAFSAVLCLRRLLRSPAEYRVTLSKIGIDRGMIKEIIQNGLPAGVQNSIICLANVVVQSNINVFGKLAMAGCGAYSRIEGFGFLPVTCFAMSLTTFIGQNLGAGQYDRAKKGARFGVLCSISMAEIMGILIYFLSPVLIAAFNQDPEVIAYGVSQARTVTLFYFLLAFSHCVVGILRGAGKSIVPMLVMISIWCVLRISYITIIVRIIPKITAVFWAYPLTWGISSAIFLVYLLKADWLHGFEKKAQE